MTPDEIREGLIANEYEWHGNHLAEPFTHGLILIEIAAQLAEIAAALRTGNGG